MARSSMLDDCDMIECPPTLDDAVYSPAPQSWDLLARTGSAGPDEVRRPRAPDQGGELWAPDPLRSVRWSSIVSPCRSSRRRRARQTLEPAFSFRVRCPGLGLGLSVD